MNTQSKIDKFQQRRRLMITGLLIVVFGALFYILNTLYGFASHTANLPVFVVCLIISLVSYMLYQCPYCGKYPEESDLPLLDPKQCAHCAGQLK